LRLTSEPNVHALTVCLSSAFRGTCLRAGKPAPEFQPATGSPGSEEMADVSALNIGFNVSRNRANSSRGAMKWTITSIPSRFFRYAFDGEQ